MMNINIIFIALSFLVQSVESQLPSSYDSRSIWKHCSGFSVILNQGHCSTCCAMALSSALSARECMRDGRDISYSGQQIWDCAGPAALATCANGSLLDQMIQSLGRGARSSQGLISGNCSLYEDRDVNASMCRAAYDGCSRDPDGASQIEGSVFYDLMWYNGNPEFAAWAASRSMMAEIWANGPVVTVITMNSHEYDLFSGESYLKNKKVFVPAAANGSSIVRHCLMVYGWGQDELTGLNYWLVQNSWGEKWGDGGTARILRGMNWLETEWRGVSTSPRQCLKGDKCLNSTYSRLINVNKSSISSNIKQMSYQLYVATTALWLPNDKLSNLEIFVITMGAALCLSILVYIFVIPNTPPPPPRTTNPFSYRTPVDPRIINVYGQSMSLPVKNFIQWK